MFQVNRSENCLVRLEKKRFADMKIQGCKLQERKHLQEWLAQMPDVLGEDLLIIQKEFAGFADTNERFDLLALDKDGRLVIIENKLDDSGRDVTWQALKYVAYCSSLKKAEIVEIYQKYLDHIHQKYPDHYSIGPDAVTNLCEFLEVEELDDVVLNEGNDQRLMLVAANFRKEVTATVLWLLGHGVRAQCFRIVPYGFDEEYFVDVQQIIPTPEAADYMIGMAAKESEEKSLQGARKRSHKLRYEFWTQALDALRTHNVSRFENISPSTDHWLSGATGVTSCTYGLIFSKNEARVELYLHRSDTEENKWIFDQLAQKKQELEHEFGAELLWQRLDHRKASRISHSLPIDGYDTENWPEMIEWLCKHIVKLDKVFSKPLGHVNEELKSGGGPSTVDQNAPRSDDDA